MDGEFLFALLKNAYKFIKYDTGRQVICAMMII